MEVIATGKITTFPGQSKYQLIIETLEPAGVGALLAQLEERRKRPRGGGAVRPRAQAAPALPARRDRRRHLAHGRRHPRHPAPAGGPLSAPRARLAGARAGRDHARRRSRAAIRGFNALPPGGRDPAAGPDHRGARRRLAGGPLGLQRGGRGPRRRRERHPADLGRRARDRHDADRLRRRRARADADRRGGDGGARALGAAGATWISARRLVAALCGSSTAAVPTCAPPRAPCPGPRTSWPARASGSIWLRASSPTRWC